MEGRNFGEILREIVIAGAMAGIMDGLKNGLKDGGKKASERIIKKFEESRAELLAFIRSLAAIDKKASETLIQRQRVRQLCEKRSYPPYEQYQPGDEDRYVELLTKLYRVLDEPEEKEMRKEIFKWLGRLSDEDFDATLEFLHHDVFIQWLKKSWGWVKEIWGKLYSTDLQNPGLYQKMEIGKKVKKSVDGRLEIFLGTQNLGEFTQKLKQIRSQLQDDIKAEKERGRRWTSLWKF